MRRVLAPAAALLALLPVLSASGGTAERCTRELAGGLKPASEIRGTPSADALSGTGDKDRLLGLGGADSLLGAGGDDCLLGGDDADRLDGEAGADDVEGQAGDDDVGGGEDSDLVEGDLGNDRVGGGPGDDSLGAGSDQMRPPRPVALSREERFGLVNESEAGDDSLDGGADDDSIAGGPGDDVVFGGGGADLIEGGPGGDRLDGGAGPDVIGGGQGRSRIDAGPGNDAVSSTNGVRDVVRCGSGSDRVRADRGDRLIGCERRILERSPFPKASPSTGRPDRVFTVRSRALFSVSGRRDDSFYELDVTGPPGCRGTSVESRRVRRGGTISLAIPPYRGNGRRSRTFCRGSYEGTLLLRVFEQESDSCGEENPDEDCAVGFDTVIGRVSFRVR